MENQHRKIVGYRELSQTEIDLMNRIKTFGPALEELIRDINVHVREQSNATLKVVFVEGDPDGKSVIDEDERERLGHAEPYRWASIGKTHLQQGLMALTRAVAQPGFF